ncbi:EF-hand domain-containing protein [Pseudodesulfovibrio sp. zrk46]|uniref:EF-hand domain-containing protein n=1 Tax=Pseudodesulfovibrio sp. zrk46 TaxID=2725288 RepID=UPI001448E66E|nr:EF-hand domain-containing protein [Pseudodesulfovibrio sp. zrk46]QJB57219.1 hypothetical protein HFN16_12745 [Pseudodesulfovibrio sp. zrk46]
MEISSMNSMVGMMGMQGGMSGLQGQQQPPDSEEMSSSFIDALDSDGDGALSESEFSANQASESSESSEVFDALDTNEDGFVSQEELQADMETKMASAPPPPPQSMSGIQTDGDMDSWQQLMNMGSSEEDDSSGASKYSQMQESMFGSSFAESLTSGLSVSA